MWTDALLVAGAYLLGSISTAVIACRLAGLPDPRAVGSRNPGATNVLRMGGRGLAAATLAGDALKGLLPVAAASAWASAPWVVAGAALAAFLGHLYPVFFGFKGGKGVATAFGAMAGVSGPLALALVATWLAVAGLFRYSSLAALTAALLAPAYAAAFGVEGVVVAALVAMAALLVWRHRSNIRNLLGGTERRIGQRVSPPPDGT